MTYAEQLKSPKWQKKRLEVLESNNFTCQICGEDTVELHVHHVNYESNRKVWDYRDDQYLVLCKHCHESWHHETSKLIQKLANVIPYENAFGFDDINLFIDFILTRGVSERRRFAEMMKDEIDGRLPI